MEIMRKTGTVQIEVKTSLDESKLTSQDSLEDAPHSHPEDIVRRLTVEEIEEK